MLETKEVMHAYDKNISYSDAVKNEIEAKCGNELLLFISMYQTSKKFKENQSLRLFQKWTYQDVNGQAVLTCHNENGRKVFQSDVTTDAPLTQGIQLIVSEGEVFTAAEW